MCVTVCSCMCAGNVHVHVRVRALFARATLRVRARERLFVRVRPFVREGFFFLVASRVVVRLKGGMEEWMWRTFVLPVRWIA